MANTPDQQPPPKRRRRRGRRGRGAVPVDQRCVREGCPRRAADTHPTCSVLCSLVHQRMLLAEETCRIMGPGPQSGALWAAVVTLSDALTDFHAEAMKGDHRRAVDAGA